MSLRGCVSVQHESTLFIIMNNYYYTIHTHTVAVAGPVITVKKNSTVSLHCSIAETINSTSVTPRIDWYKWSFNKDGNSIPVLTNYRPINTTLDRNYNVTANGNLVIDSSSSGYYYCKKEASPTNIVLSCPAVLINPPGMMYIVDYYEGNRLRGRGKLCVCVRVNQ